MPWVHGEPWEMDKLEHADGGSLEAAPPASGPPFPSLLVCWPCLNL